MAKTMHSALKLTTIILFSFVLAITSTSCIRFIGLRGSGEVITEERNISQIDSISISAGINLYLERTGVEALRIEAEDNIIPLIITRVSDGELNIRYDRFVLGGIFTRRPVNIYVNIDKINSLRASSGANLESGPIKTETLSINLSSGANGEIDLDVTELESRLSSGANLRVSGSTENQDINVSSGANYDGSGLRSNNAIVNVSSGGFVQVNVSENLIADISSGGRVIHYGDPQIVSNISSGGSLESGSEN